MSEFGIWIHSLARRSGKRFLHARRVDEVTFDGKSPETENSLFSLRNEVFPVVNGSIGTDV